MAGELAFNSVLQLYTWYVHNGELLFRQRENHFWPPVCFVGHTESSAAHSGLASSPEFCREVCTTVPHAWLLQTLLWGILFIPTYHEQERQMDQVPNIVRITPQTQMRKLQQEIFEASTVVAYTFNPSRGKGRQADFSEFEPSPVFSSSEPGRAHSETLFQ